MVLVGWLVEEVDMVVGMELGGVVSGVCIRCVGELGVG